MNDNVIEPNPAPYDPDEYIVTATLVKVSRNNVFCGTQNIHLAGKAIIYPNVTIRGDFARVNIGRYCVLHENVVLRPPHKLLSSGLAFYPISIGDCVMIGADTISEASSIGSGCVIGKGCVLGKRCIIRDNCTIEDHTIVAPDSVIAPFSYVAGAPGKFIRELPEATTELHRIRATSYFNKFIGTK